MKYQNSNFDEFNKNLYGLAKIEDYLKNSNPDTGIFTFGIDLTNFGLNINDSPE